MNRMQLVAAIFGVLVACSLIAASFGVVAVDLLLNDDADPEEFNDVDNSDLLDELRERVANDPADVESMGLLAELLAYDGRLDEAIQWFEQALTLDPGNTAIRLSFAISLSQGGKEADAELQFRKVIEAEPNNYEAHYYLADLYRLWDPPRLDEAAAHYQRVIEISPDAYLAERSWQYLIEMGYATPVATPAGTPVAATMEGSA